MAASSQPWFSFLLFAALLPDLSLVVGSPSRQDSSSSGIFVVNAEDKDPTELSKDEFWQFIANEVTLSINDTVKRVKHRRSNVHHEAASTEEKLPAPSITLPPRVAEAAQSPLWARALMDTLKKTSELLDEEPRLVEKSTVATEASKTKQSTVDEVLRSLGKPAYGTENLGKETGSLADVAPAAAETLEKHPALADIPPSATEASEKQLEAAPVLAKPLDLEEEKGISDHVLGALQPLKEKQSLVDNLTTATATKPLEQKQGLADNLTTATATKALEQKKGLVVHITIANATAKKPLDEKQGLVANLTTATATKPLEEKHSLVDNLTAAAATKASEEKQGLADILSDTRGLVRNVAAAKTSRSRVELSSASAETRKRQGRAGTVPSVAQHVQEKHGLTGADSAVAKAMAPAVEEPSEEKKVSADLASDGANLLKETSDGTNLLKEKLESSSPAAMQSRAKEFLANSAPVVNKLSKELQKDITSVADKPSKEQEFLSSIAPVVANLSKEQQNNIASALAKPSKENEFLANIAPAIANLSKEQRKEIASALAKASKEKQVQANSTPVAASLSETKQLDIAPVVVEPSKEQEVLANSTPVAPAIVEPSKEKQVVLANSTPVVANLSEPKQLEIAPADAKPLQEEGGLSDNVSVAITPSTDKQAQTTVTLGSAPVVANLEVSASSDEAAKHNASADWSLWAWIPNMVKASSSKEAQVNASLGLSDPAWTSMLRKVSSDKAVEQNASVEWSSLLRKAQGSSSFLREGSGLDVRTNASAIPSGQKATQMPAVRNLNVLRNGKAAATNFAAAAAKQKKARNRASVGGGGNTFLPHSQQSEIFMRYMPRREMVVCSCAKCGSTSMYEYLFEQEFNESWSACLQQNNTDCRSDVASGPQSITSPRWQNSFEMVKERPSQREIMQKAFSFALIRDPKERLLSAWKSKVSCNESFGVDLYDRAHFDQTDNRWKGFVPGLRRLQGKEDNVTCIALKGFLKALRDIHRAGNAKYLDRHFLPQNLGCFYRFKPDAWSKVVAISQPNAFASMARRVHSDVVKPPQTHSSWRDVGVDQEIEDLLDEVTREEYKMLAPYLQSPAAF